MTDFADWGTKHPGEFLAVICILLFVLFGIIGLGSLILGIVRDAIEDRTEDQ